MADRLQWLSDQFLWATYGCHTSVKTVQHHHWPRCPDWQCVTVAGCAGACKSILVGTLTHCPVSVVIFRCHSPSIPLWCGGFTMASWRTRTMRSVRQFLDFPSRKSPRVVSERITHWKNLLHQLEPVQFSDITLKNDCPFICQYMVTHFSTCLSSIGAHNGNLQLSLWLWATRAVLLCRLHR